MKTQQLQITAFPFDNRIAHSSRIEITRYGNYIEVKQDNQILGSINIVPDIDTYPDPMEQSPMVVINICNGVRNK